MDDTNILITPYGIANLFGTGKFIYDHNNNSWFLRQSQGNWTEITEHWLKKAILVAGREINATSRLTSNLITDTMNELLARSQGPNVGQQWTWDRLEPEEIPCLDGIYNIKTGEIYDFQIETKDIEHYLDPDPDAPVPAKWGELMARTRDRYILSLYNIHLKRKRRGCPRFIKFIEEVQQQGGEEAMEVLCAYILNTLLPRVENPYILWLLGQGGNGKGVYSHLLQHMCPKPIIIDFTTQETRFAYGDLEHSRLIVVTETTDNEISSYLPMIKSISGGDSVRIERKYKAPYSIKPLVRMLVSSNTLPKITKSEKIALGRRVLPIQFRSTFEGRAEPFLDQVLSSEISDIFWLCTEYAPDYLDILREWQMEHSIENDFFIKEDKDEDEFFTQHLQYAQGGLVNTTNLWAKYPDLHKTMSERSFHIQFSRAAEQIMNTRGCIGVKKERRSYAGHKCTIYLNVKWK